MILVCVSSWSTTFVVAVLRSCRFAQRRVGAKVPVSRLYATRWRGLVKTRLSLSERTPDTRLVMHHTIVWYHAVVVRRCVSERRREQRERFKVRTRPSHDTPPRARTSLAGGEGSPGGCTNGRSIRSYRSRTSLFGFTKPGHHLCSRQRTSLARGEADRPPRRLTNGHTYRLRSDEACPHIYVRTSVTS